MAAKCCEPKRCADRVRSRTEALEGKSRNLNFSPSNKRQLSILLNFFTLSICRYLTFSSSLKLQHCQTIVLLHSLFPLRNDEIFLLRSSLRSWQNCICARSFGGEATILAALPREASAEGEKARRRPRTDFFVYLCGQN